MNSHLHPMDSRWEVLARQRYQQAYPELVGIFRQLLSRSFLRNYWIPDPLALDYLAKILIRFLPVTLNKEDVELALAISEAEADDPQSIIRVYENLGELILWWSGIYRKTLFQSEGKRSFEIAYEHLSDYESSPQSILMPGQEDKLNSKRLKVNKMFSEHFENFQEILKKSDLIEDPAYLQFRNMFMTDDFSIN